MQLLRLSKREISYSMSRPFPSRGRNSHRPMTDDCAHGLAPHKCKANRHGRNSCTEAARSLQPPVYRHTSHARRHAWPHRGADSGRYKAYLGCAYTNHAVAFWAKAYLRYRQWCTCTNYATLASSGPSPGPTPARRCTCSNSPRKFRCNSGTQTFLAMV